MWKILGFLTHGFAHYLTWRGIFIGRNHFGKSQGTEGTHTPTDKLNRNEAVVCVVGLGYVGLPLAIESSKSLRVIGYEIDEDKIKRLNNSKLNQENTNLFITNDPAKDKRC